MRSGHALRRYFRRFGGQEVQVAVEACGFWPAFREVVEPEVKRLAQRVKATASAKLKNDRVDSETLAHLLRCDLLPESWKADRETQARRQQARLRATLVRHRTRLKNQVHAVLHQQSVKLTRPSTYRWSSCRTVLFFALVVGATLLTKAHAVSWTVRAQPTKLVNGAPVLFQVKAPARLESLTGTWLGHQVTFGFDTSTKTWFALAGVGFETAPGTYTLELAGERRGPKTSDNKVTFSRKFAVARGKYPKIKIPLTVEGKFTEPSPQQVKEIEEAKAVKQDYLNRVTPEREWSGKFSAPADATISDVFGSQRVFNNKASSPHQGLDFRVPSGTPVAAMNSGTVLLARPLYYEGNFVVIDHGQGLLTLYLHLSVIKVTEGDHVDRGQEIGLSGGTGRATGPHLHVAVRWQGTYLDPARLMQLRLP